MKGITELALGAILLVLVYDKPTALTEFANSILGKVILIMMVACIAKARGITSGLLAALIMMLLMHTSIEGLANSNEGDNPTCTPKRDSKPINCKDKEGPNGPSCGVARTKCGANGECMVEVYPAAGASNAAPSLEVDVVSKDVETFDVRLHEGINNMNSNRATIEGMKFQNGFTGNREAFQGFI